MAKKCCKCVGYIFFVIAMVAAGFNIYYLRLVQKEYAGPNSIDCETAVRHTEKISYLIAFFAPAGLILLCLRVGKFGAMLYFLILFVILIYALIAIVRALTWRYSNKMGKNYDMRNYSAQLAEATNFKSISKHMKLVQQKKKCCGVVNYTEWTQILRQRRVPSSCCIPPQNDKRAPHKCGIRAFLELDALAAVDLTEKTGFYIEPTHKHFHLAPPSFRIPILKQITPLEVKNIQGQALVDSMKAAKFDACSPSNAHQVVYFYNRIDYGNSSLEVDPTHKYTYRAVNTRVLCYAIFLRQRNIAKSTIYTVVAYDAWSFANRSVLYVEGCSKYLIEYTDKICRWALFLASALAILIILMMILFHYYYWEYRKVEIVNAALPFWFEKLNEDDNVQILGLGSKASIEAMRAEGENKRQRERTSSEISRNRFRDRQTARGIEEFSILAQAEELQKNKQEGWRKVKTAKMATGKFIKRNQVSDINA